MKTFYAIIFFACAPFFLHAQCQIQAAGFPCSCFGICDGSAVCTMFGGTGPYTFVWSPGGQTTPSVMGLCAGTYTVTGTDAVGCMVTATATVTQPAQIIVTTTGNAASCPSCCDGLAAAFASGGTGAYTYTWTGPNNYTSSNQTINNLCAGTYTCCVTDANGCSACATYVVNFSTGIANSAASGNLDVFPIPATDFISVKEGFAISSSVVISISNILGETVITRSVSHAIEINETINLSGLDAGIYFVTVKTAAGTSVKRFVKE